MFKSALINGEDLLAGIGLKALFLVIIMLSVMILTVLKKQDTVWASKSPQWAFSLQPTNQFKNDVSSTAGWLASKNKSMAVVLATAFRLRRKLSHFSLPASSTLGNESSKKLRWLVPEFERQYVFNERRSSMPDAIMLHSESKAPFHGM